MSIVNLFFNRPQPSQILRTISGSAVAPLILDATVKESFAVTAEPTQHPVEDGADITDHVIIRPNTLTISGIVTETPFEGVAGFLKAAGATVASAIGSSLGRFSPGASALGGAAGAIGGAAIAKSLASAIFGSNERTLGAICSEFIKVRDARLPVDIQTGLRLYKNYILASFTAGRDQKTGGSINVDLEFKELIIVQSEITQVAIPKVKGGVGGTKHGNQSKEPLSSDQNGQGSSILKHIFGG